MPDEVNYFEGFIIMTSARECCMSNVGCCISKDRAIYISRQSSFLNTSKAGFEPSCIPSASLLNYVNCYPRGRSCSREKFLVIIDLVRMRGSLPRNCAPRLISNVMVSQLRSRSNGQSHLRSIAPRRLQLSFLICEIRGNLFFEFLNRNSSLS